MIDLVQTAVYRAMAELGFKTLNGRALKNARYSIEDTRMLFTKFSLMNYEQTLNVGAFIILKEVW